MRKQTTGKTLLDCFVPPRGMRGDFGWVCGYSASSAFMDEALSAFTTLSKSQRAQQGQGYLALVTDPGNVYIPSNEAPGILHLRFEKRRFRLLHAKVALLAFRPMADPDPDIRSLRLRLVISTGNWTLQTANESLDLVWCSPDIALEDKAHDLTSFNDMASAWEVFRHIRRRLPETELSLVLGASLASTATGEAAGRFEKLIKRIVRGTEQARSRVFHNIGKTMLDAVIEHGLWLDLPRSANYLAMGSGFFESHIDESGSVIETIQRQLQSEGFIQKNTTVDLFVNPAACQGIAEAEKQLKEKGILILAARDPDKENRSLHAKFVFAGRWQERRSHYSRGWLYLGSANLTPPAFLKKAGSRGNLECGVVFPLPGKMKQKELERHLPIHSDYRKISVPVNLEFGNQFEMQPVRAFAPPIPFMRWIEDERGARLEVPSESSCDIELSVLVDGEEVLVKDGTVPWNGAQPLIVTVCWQIEGECRTAEVPVVDTYGRIAALPAPPLDIDMAISELAAFPLAAAPDLSEDEEDEESEMLASIDRKNVSGQDPGVTPEYPIRDMVRLLDQILETQLKVPESLWHHWTNRLSFVLRRLQEADHVRFFREELKLDPLALLVASSSLPDALSESQRAQLHDAIERIRRLWGTHGLDPLILQ